jgi:subtilisin family serine protease
VHKEDRDKTDWPEDEYYDIDKVLTLLAAHFETEYLGWIPPMGKNRTVGLAIEGGVIIREGSPPRLPDPPDKWPSWLKSPRLSGPGRGVVVGLADTLIAPQTWMNGACVAQYSDRLWGDPPTWQSGHATFLAGLILSQAPGATIDARCVLDTNGTGTSWDVAKKIMQFADSGVDVLNLSFGAFTYDGKPPLAIATAISKLSTDIVVVAAAGNHGELDKEKHENVRPLFPASLPGVVAVGSAKRDGTLSKFSPPAEWVDVIADGEDLVSLFPAGKLAFKKNPSDEELTTLEFAGYASWSGTSFSAALISGAIAAGTQRGRISARQSWENIREQLPKRPRTHPGVSRDPAEKSDLYLRLGL